MKRALAKVRKQSKRLISGVRIEILSCAPLRLGITGLGNLENSLVGGVELSKGEIFTILWHGKKDASIHLLRVMKK